MSNSYLSALLEEIRDQNRIVLEAVSDMQIKVSQLDFMRADIQALKQDVRVIKAALIDMSRVQLNHEHRITRLESN